LKRIHIDFWLDEILPSKKLNKEIQTLLEMINANGGEIIIIAGDIGHHFTQDTAFLKALKNIYNNVIIVHGNHDMYLINDSIRKKYKNNSFLRLSKMKNFCKEHSIIYLDGQVVDINGFKFGGTGMSWDTSYYEKLINSKLSKKEVLKLYRKSMSDARLICGGINSLFDPFKFFEDEKQRLEGIKNADVMVSHVGPIIPSNLSKLFSESLITTFFYFDGIKYVERINPKFWIFGHTHDNYNFYHNGTNLLCNPLGYPMENSYNVIKSFEM
jgi:predicted phosphodiesterase